MDSRPVLTLGELNWNLLDGLLPVIDAAGRRVLLGCDDSSLRSILSDDGAAELVRVLKSEQPVTTAHGFRAVMDAAAAFDRQPRPRPDPPPHLAALCVCVLAASRMDYTEQHATSAYYTHLLDLLGIDGRDEWPHVLGFEDLMDRGFAQLADWLADDQGGTRGLLLLPSDPSPRYVGLPISQTVLRGRDRVLLSDFFWRYRRPLEAGWNPARLVRLWGGRHLLTAPARERLDDRQFAGQLTAALRSAYRAWDGTRSDSEGRRVWPATLRLGVSPVRAVLHASVPALSGPVFVTSANRQRFELAAHPDETAIPLDWLAHTAEAPLRVQTIDGGGLVELLDSPTMLFELTDIGLESVPLAGQRPVWALTCDPRLTSLPLPPARFHRQPLPAGWKLVVGLTADELPEDLRSPGQDPEPDTGRDAELGNGLPLGERTWLIDHPPSIVSRLPEPALLYVDDAEQGDLDPGQRRVLDTIGSVLGVHRIELGAVFEAEIEISDHGLRHGSGSVRWDFGHPALVRHGPRSGEHPLGGQGAVVVGAAVDSAPSLDWHPPILLRGGETAHAIHTSGTVTAHWPAPAPAWLRHAGLADDGNPEWSIDDDGTIVWVCVEHPVRPRVIAVREIAVQPTDDALDVAWQFADAAVIDLTEGGAAQRWRKLVDIAGDDDG